MKLFWALLKCAIIIIVWKCYSQTLSWLIAHKIKQTSSWRHTNQVTKNVLKITTVRPLYTHNSRIIQDLILTMKKTKHNKLIIGCFWISMSMYKHCYVYIILETKWLFVYLVKNHQSKRQKNGKGEQLNPIQPSHRNF